MYMWWVSLGQQPDTHSAGVLLPLLNRAGQEKTMKKLMGWNRHQLPSWAKRLSLGKIGTASSSVMTFNYKLLLMSFFNSVVQIIKQHTLKLMFPCLTNQWVLLLIMDHRPDTETICLKIYVLTRVQFVSLNYISIFAYSAIWLMHCKQISNHVSYRFFNSWLICLLLQVLAH